MPWTVEDVERHNKGLSDKKKQQWVRVANSALQRCHDEGGQECEASAIRQANAVVAKDDWGDEDWNVHDDFFLLGKDERTEPGGSNVGKYRVGPFCGPSGGAPEGSFPVNTRARAKAALSYARHAPNPAGIRACVCRHFPDLPSCQGKKNKDISLKFFRKDEEKQIVYGVVFEPDYVDAQGDWICEKDIEEAAHDYMIRLRRSSGQAHQKLSHGDSIDHLTDIVECYVAPVSFEYEGQEIKKGSWVVAMKIHDGKLWQRTKKDIVGFSAGGKAQVLD